MRVRCWLLCAALLFAPSTGRAEPAPPAPDGCLFEPECTFTFLVANLTGSANVPPHSSDGWGFARVVLGEGPDARLFVNVSYSGLETAVELGHIHGPAGPGSVGPIIALMVPSQIGQTSGRMALTNYAPSPDQVAALKAGLWYIDIHTSASPHGELRGQFTVDPVMTTTLSGPQVVPPTTTTGTGRAWVSFNDTRIWAFISMRWSLPLNNNQVHLHAGRPGAPEIALGCDLSGSSAPTLFMTNFLCPMSAGVARLIETGGYFLDVHTITHPAGEVRGQIKRSWNACDFDGDAKSDLVVARNTGTSVDWWIRLSGGGTRQFSWGDPADHAAGRIMCADVDGDGKADATIWRAGVFWTRLSSGGVRVQHWGQTGDDPQVVADYDSDGRDDFAVYRPGTSTYWIRLSTGGTRAESWGLAGDVLQLLPDYDGDGIADLAVRRGSIEWRKLSAAGNIEAINWGLPTDAQMSADFDGDGHSDVASVRGVSGQRQWWIRGSISGTPVAPYGNGFFFGGATDVLTAADFDGDRRTDLAVWTPASGVWWIQRTTAGLATIAWGAPGDMAVHAAYWH